MTHDDWRGEIRARYLFAGRVFDSYAVAGPYAASIPRPWSPDETTTVAPTRRWQGVGSDPSDGVGSSLHTAKSECVCVSVGSDGDGPDFLAEAGAKESRRHGPTFQSNPFWVMVLLIWEWLW